MSKSDEPITRFTSMEVNSPNENGTDPSSKEPDGFYLPSMTTEEINMIPISILQDGALIFNTTTSHIVAYINGIWVNLSADGPSEFIAPSAAVDPTPPINGLIYYNTINNVLRVQGNGNTNTIVTTPDPAGNYVVQTYINSTYISSPLNGMIYYASEIETLQTFQRNDSLNNNVFSSILVSNAPDTESFYGPIYYKNTALDPNLSETFDAGLIYYNGHYNVIRVTQNVDFTPTWFTMVTTPDLNGNIVAQNFTTDPSVTTLPGLIYYNTTHDVLKVLQGGEVFPDIYSYKSIVTTSDLDGNIVLRDYTNGNTPTLVNGILFYDGSNSLLRTQINGNTNTIVTTPDFNGNIVALNNTSNPSSPLNGMIYYNTTSNSLQAYENGAWVNLSGGGPSEFIAPSAAVDPVGGIVGQMYYNTTDNAIRSYVNGAWNYLSPKPHLVGDFQDITFTSLTSIPQLVSSVTIGAQFAISNFAFANNNTRYVYTGSYRGNYLVTISFSFHCTLSATVTFQIFINSVEYTVGNTYVDVASSTDNNTAVIRTTADIGTNDYIEIYGSSSVANNTVTGRDFCLSIESVD